MGVRVESAIEEEGIRGLLAAAAQNTLELGIDLHSDDLPNVAPTEIVEVIHVRNGAKVSSLMSWGFPLPDRPMIINARAETILDRNLFAKAAQERRCIIPAQGFYEWAKGTPRQPWCFVRKDGLPMALAGLYRSTQAGLQFVVCTTEPNQLVSEMHDRMPCLLRDEDLDLWLRGETIKAVQRAMDPFPADLMDKYPVTTAMSNPRYKFADAHSRIATLFD